eukprot:6213266-Pleurochrysis_carterae.AAC.3
MRVRVQTHTSARASRLPVGTVVLVPPVVGSKAKKLGTFRTVSVLHHLLNRRHEALLSQQPSFAPHVCNDDRAHCDYATIATAMRKSARLLAEGSAVFFGSMPTKHPTQLTHTRFSAKVANHHCRRYSLTALGRFEHGLSPTCWASTGCSSNYSAGRVSTLRRVPFG